MIDQGRQRRPWSICGTDGERARRLAILAPATTAVAQLPQRDAIATAINAAIDAPPPIVRCRVPRQTDDPYSTKDEGA